MKRMVSSVWRHGKYRYKNKYRYHISHSVLIVVVCFFVVSTLAIRGAFAKGFLVSPTAKPKDKNTNTAINQAKRAGGTDLGQNNSNAAQPGDVSTQTTTSAVITNDPCSSVKKYSNNTVSTDPVVQKLVQYKDVCGPTHIKKVSFFSGMPRTTSEADSLAYDVAQSLKSLIAAGVQPLVFVEPMYGDSKLDLTVVQTGAYDSVFAYYLQALARNGITNTNIGTWVFFPEPNIPEWTSIDPAVYVSNVTRYTTMLKSIFTAAKVSLLLDSTSYESNSYDSTGKQVSLLPYVKGIPLGLVDSLGLQGFPWAAPHNSNDTSLIDANVFLPYAIAAEVANYLQVKNVWFNSGTYSVYYANNAAQKVTVSPSERLVILDGVISQLKALRSQGFTVSMHLFAENKSNTAEAVDWSYWHESPFNSTNNTQVFVDFANKLSASSIDLWLFDSM